MKKLRIEKFGFVWHIDGHAIADNRAKYYVSIDNTTTYQDEYDYLMNNKDGEFEIADWYLNNMDWDDVSAENKRLICSPKLPESPDDIDERLEISYRVFDDSDNSEKEAA